MPIQLTTPKTNPNTGELMPLAIARNIRIDPIDKIASYEMWFLDAAGIPTHYVDRYVYRDMPSETAVGTDPATGIQGVYEVHAADPAFTNLVSKAVHVVAAGEEGTIISAYDLIADNAIYTHEIAVRPELYDGTII